MAIMHTKLYTAATPGITPGVIATWTAPAGVHQVLVKGCGAGGGGGGGSNYGGAGGGGAKVAEYLATVVPNTTYNFVIGAGGLAGTIAANSGVYGGDGGDGGNTYFSSSVTYIFRGAMGGAGGLSTAAGNSSGTSQISMGGLSVKSVAGGNTYAVLANATVMLVPQPGQGGTINSYDTYCILPFGSRYIGGSTMAAAGGLGAGGGGASEWLDNVPGYGGGLTSANNGTLGAGGGGGLGGPDAAHAAGTGGDGALLISWWI